MDDTATTATSAWLSERLPQVTGWEVRGTRRWRGRVSNEAYGDCWCLAVCDEPDARFMSRMLDVATVEAAMFDIEARTFGKLEHALSDAGPAGVCGARLRRQGAAGVRRRRRGGPVGGP